MAEALAATWPHRVLQLRHGAVEVGAQLLVVGREDLVDPVGEIAGRQALEPRGHEVDDMVLLGGGFGQHGGVAGPLRSVRRPAAWASASSRSFSIAAALKTCERRRHGADLVAARRPETSTVRSPRASVPITSASRTRGRVILAVEIQNETQAANSTAATPAAIVSTKARDACELRSSAAWVFSATRASFISQMPARGS